MTNKQPRYIQSCISSQYFHCVTPYLPQQIKVIHLIPLRVGFQKPLKWVFEGRYQAKKNSRWLANGRGKQNQEDLLQEDQYTMYGYFLEQNISGLFYCTFPNTKKKIKDMRCSGVFFYTLQGVLELQSNKLLNDGEIAAR